MKNQKGFTHWVIVILISVMAIGLVGVAWWYEENKEDDTNTTTNSSINTNTGTNVNTSVNTNTEANENKNTNTNTDSIGDKPSAQYQDAGIYQINNNGDTGSITYAITPGQESTEYFTIPEGFTLISRTGDKIIWLEKSNNIYRYDFSDGSTHLTSLPELLTGDIRYETAGPRVYSVDGTEVMMQYNLYDKNSQEYKNEFAGPQPISYKRYRYIIDSDTYTTADNMTAPFYAIWDTQQNVAYYYLTGEGIGCKTPIKKVDVSSGTEESSADYGNNSCPAFSADGTKLAVPKVDEAPLQINIFSLPDITTPTQSFTLPNVQDAPPATNVIGYIYNLQWLPGNEQLLLSFENRIFLINLQNESAQMIFNDSDHEASYTEWNYYPTISQSGSFVYYVDYGNTNQSSLDRNNNVYTMKTYDVQTQETTNLLTTYGTQSILLVGPK